MFLENEEILERNANVLKYRNIKKIRIICSLIIIVIFILLMIPLVIHYYNEWSFNQAIINNNETKIELTERKELKLWNMSIKNIINNNKYIEISYDSYKVKLNSQNLATTNNIDLQVDNKKSEYQKFKKQDILEIDVSKVNPYNVVEQIDINVKDLLKGLKRVDLYGIKLHDKKIEYIETKEIQDENITLILREEYEKYVFVYVPVEEIILEKEEIEIFKNETYKLQLKVKPDNATSKVVHIDDFEEEIIQIKDDGTIEAFEVGNIEFTIEAEEGKIKKKIKVIVKAKAEGIKIESENIELTEGESKLIEAKILPEEVEEKSFNYESSDTKIATVDKNGNIKAIKEGKATITITTNAEPVQKREIIVTVKKEEVIEENTVQIYASNSQSNKDNSIIEGNYIKGILIVNKQYTLPSNYDPGTNNEALQAFYNMKDRARNEGISLKIVSGYRTYQTQKSIYQRNVNLYGEEVANRFSAKPRTI